MKVQSKSAAGFLVLVLLLFFSGAVFGEEKTALVIGNSSYQHFPVLSRPWQEAAAVKAALERLGFDINTIMMNVRRDVYEKTGGEQVPGEYSQLFEAVYLAGTRNGTEAAVSSAKAPDGFVLVEAGTFTMGSPSNEANRNSDEKQHTVRISRDFYISKCEMTQAEYRSIMGSEPFDTGRGIGDNYPVNNVTWYDAVEYCNKRSQREGLKPAYTINKNQPDPNNTSKHDNVRWTVTYDFTANDYRLPTEAEWEYAARGGQNTGGVQCIRRQ